MTAETGPVAAAEAVLAALNISVEGHEPVRVKTRTTESGWLADDCSCGDFGWPCPIALRAQNDAARAVAAGLLADPAATDTGAAQAWDEGFSAGVSSPANRAFGLGNPTNPYRAVRDTTEPGEQP